MGFFCVTGLIFSLVGGALGYHSSFFILHSFLFQGVRVRGKGQCLGSRPVISKFSKAALFEVFCVEVASEV